MKTTLYQIDAFTDRLFAGNPAAVCPLEAWLPAGTMQAIAAENDLSETAFFAREDAGWHIRWFTPGNEGALCGHATLASAFIYFHYMAPDAGRITFDSLSGPLQVARDGELLTLGFPVRPPEPVSVPPEALRQALGVNPVEALAAADGLVVVEGEDTVRHLRPDLVLLGQLDRRGVIVTAEGRDCDFVSRFFAPNYGVGGGMGGSGRLRGWCSPPTTGWSS